MNIRHTVTALIATGALLGLGACTNDSDGPDTAPEAPVTSVSVRPSTSVSVSPSPSVSVSTSVSASPAVKKPDTGISYCKSIIDNIKASKMPVPLDYTDDEFATARRHFSDSRYDDVQKAGEDFIDDYRATVRAGAKADVDANELTASAKTLVAACQKHM